MAQPVGLPPQAQGKARGIYGTQPGLGMRRRFPLPQLGGAPRPTPPPLAAASPARPLSLPTNLSPEVATRGGKAMKGTGQLFSKGRKIAGGRAKGGK